MPLKKIRDEKLTISEIEDTNTFVPYTGATSNLDMGSYYPIIPRVFFDANTIGFQNVEMLMNGVGLTIQGQSSGENIDFELNTKDLDGTDTCSLFLVNRRDVIGGFHYSGGQINFSSSGLDIKTQHTNTTDTPITIHTSGNSDQLTLKTDGNVDVENTLFAGKVICKTPTGTTATLQAHNENATDVNASQFVISDGSSTDWATTNFYGFRFLYESNANELILQAANQTTVQDIWTFERDSGYIVFNQDISNSLKIMGRSGEAGKLTLTTNTNNIDPAGILELIEANQTWGTDAVGFRIQLDGSANELQILSGSSATIKEVLSITRDTPYVTIYREDVPLSFTTGYAGLVLENPTPATAGDVNQSSPALMFKSNYWNGTVSKTMYWAIDNQAINYGLRGDLYFKFKNDTGSWTQHSLRLAADGGTTLTKADIRENNSSLLQFINAQNSTSSYDQFSPGFVYWGSAWETTTGSSKSFKLAHAVQPESSANGTGVFKFYFAGAGVSTPVLTNELMRMEWGDSLGIVFNEHSLSSYNFELKAINDLIINGNTAWSGTFTNGDGNTVTVTKGIITDVS